MPIINMFALQICIELVGEQILSDDDLLCAAIQKENKKNRGKLRPRHLIFSAFDHREADSGDSGSVSEFSL